MQSRHSAITLRLRCFRHLIVFGLWLTTSSAAILDGQTAVDTFRPPEWFAAASLNDVVFLDPDTGFIVGNHGLILRTVDGGRNWSRANSGVTCNLQSLYFVDEKTGWAVGGYSTPPLDSNESKVEPSVGVVLKTNDGGLRWKRMPTSLPALQDVIFITATEGMAIGNGSHYYPAGLFFSNNGGATWSAGSTNQLQNFLKVTAGPQGFRGLMQNSQICKINGGQVEMESMLVPHRFKLKDLSLSQVDQQTVGIAVGHQAALLLSEKVNGPWKHQASQIDSAFDFETVDTYGHKAWMAGSPGSYVFAYDFRSRQWQKYNTGQTSSIRKIFFLDQARGWAVGDQGSILRTRDGGATWQRQRGESSDVALMIVANDPAEIPFELIAKYASEQGFLISVVLLDTKADSAKGHRSKDACSLLGNTIFHHVPLRPKTVRGRQSFDQEARQRLTKIIRSDRPFVVVSCQNSNREQNEFDSDQTVVAAVHAAADKYQFQTQITNAGLQTWSVKRMLIKSNHSATFDIVEHGSQILVKSGGLLSDQVALSRAIVGQSLETTDLRMIDMLPENRFRTKSLLAPAIGSLVRRHVRESSTARVDQIKKMTHKRRWMAELDSWRIDDESSPRKWRTKMLAFTQSLDDQTAGLWLFERANRYWENGEASSAVATHQMFISRYPNHWLADRSASWLLHYFNSQEIEIGLGRPKAGNEANEAGNEANGADDANAQNQPVTDVRRAGYLAEPKMVNQNGQSRIIWKPVEDDQARNAAQTSHLETTPSKTGRRTRLQIAKQMLDTIRQRGTPAAHDPRIDFASANLLRKFAAANGSATPFGQISQSPTASPSLKFIARREVNLLKTPIVLPQSTVAVCSSINRKPYLDGKLDDPIWSQVMPHQVSISGDTMIASTRLVTARDQEYLYLAMIADKLVPGRPDRNRDKRTRDPDLSKNDRVSVRLDIDRDFQTWFEFTIDRDGNVSEQIHGNKKWNPDWYVAQSEDDNRWTIEAAIPLKELVGTGQGQTEVFGQHWGISVLRQNGNRTLSWPHRTDGRPFGSLKIQ